MDNILKNQTIKALQNCDDENIVNDIASILNIRNQTILLTSEQEIKIQKAVESFNKGIYIEDAKARKILNEWSKR